jgi:diacylglycerol kinase family enzyme
MTTRDRTRPARRGRIAEAFHNLGAEARFLTARSGKEIVDLARRAVAGDAGPVVAAGGDGTINAVASVLIETDRTLGVLPLGTLNHFAKDLNIPLAVGDAVRTILRVRWRKWMSGRSTAGSFSTIRV